MSLRVIWEIIAPFIWEIIFYVFLEQRFREWSVLWGEKKNEKCVIAIVFGFELKGFLGDNSSLYLEDYYNMTDHMLPVKA